MYVVYAFFISIFGESVKAIHLGLLITNLLTAITIFFIAKKFFAPIYASIISSIFCIVTLNFHLEGMSANAELYLLLPAMLGILFFLRGMEDRKRINFFISGLLLGMSYVIKQHGLFFVGFIGLYYIFHFVMSIMKQKATGQGVPGGFLPQLKNPILSGFVFVLGAIIPFGLTCLTFLYLGLFQKFWWWTVYFPRYYGSGLTLVDAWNYFAFSAGPIWNSLWFFILLAACGFIVSFKGLKNDKNFFLITFFVLSFCAISVGFLFYTHYFILGVPALCFLIAAGMEFIEKQIKFKISSYICLVLFIIGYTMIVKEEHEYMFQWDGNLCCRMRYFSNPFPEAIVFGKYMEQNSAPTDKIAVIGSEPEIFYYAHRRSATGHLYTYEMLNNQPFAHQFQVEMISEIEKAKPKFLVFVNVPFSWYSGRHDHMDTTIFTWANKYMNQYYEQVGIVNIHWPEQIMGTFCWVDKDHPTCSSEADAWMNIMRRKPDKS